MPSIPPDELTEAYRDTVGDDLRSVLHIEDLDQDVLYLREDVEETLDEETLGEAFQTLTFESWGVPPAEEALKHGSLNCIYYDFEQAVELIVPYSEGEALAVAVDGTWADRPNALIELAQL